MIEIFANSSTTTLELGQLGFFAVPIIIAYTFYVLTFQRYRNTDKRHEYERTGSLRFHITKKEDYRARTVTASKKAKISDNNMGYPYLRVGEKPTQAMKIKSPYNALSRYLKEYSKP